MFWNQAKASWDALMLWGDKVSLLDLVIVVGIIALLAKSSRHVQSLE